MARNKFEELKWAPFSILGFVADLKMIERDMHDLGPAIVEKACQMVCADAKRVIGVGYDDWPALKPETLARKIGPGPLLETGEMRASIEWNAHGLEGHVGSNSDIAVYQELGTSRIPPRPFLVGAAVHMGENIHKMAARDRHGCDRRQRTPRLQMAELIHPLRHVGHAVKEAVDKTLEPTDDDNNRKRR